ncbi:MAG: PrsW family intramembrane metalloprotease [Lachnospiraceae bacterium]|nr:PrsW family intramembrane metalloprotease [Lachnospiraceae bacterium]
MFTALPTLAIIAIYLAAAIGPAVFLMVYIYRHDKVEPEPGDLLRSLILRGVLAALASIVLEIAAERVLSMAPISESSPVYTILTAFLGVAAIEEGTKYFFMHRKVWNHPAFNYRFDAIVYAAFVSLGFAAFENIQYVASYGISVAVPRAFLAIPGHLGFSVVMGYYYGRARKAADRGDMAGSRANRWAGYLSAVFLHGFYDSCAMIGTGIASLLFVVFVIVMYVVISKLIRKEAETDEPLYMSDEGNQLL